MSIVPCRILLVDHASRAPLWEAMPSDAPANALTRLDPRPYAPWDVSALAAVYQVGAGCRNLLDALPRFASLQWCKVRLCYARDQQYVLAIIEKKERTPVDVPSMRRELEALLDAAPTLQDPPASWRAPAIVNGMPICPGFTFPEPRAVAQLPPKVRTMVLVEDDMMVRSVCLRILQAHFLIFEVNGSLDALALADRLPIPITLLVSDISLPKMDGITLSQLWLQRRPDSRVLLLSGNPYSAGLHSADVAFLQKPFLADELVRTVLHMAAPVEHVA